MLSWRKPITICGWRAWCQIIVRASMSITLNGSHLKMLFLCSVYFIKKHGFNRMVMFKLILSTVQGWCCKVGVVLQLVALLAYTVMASQQHKPAVSCSALQRHANMDRDGSKSSSWPSSQSSSCQFSKYKLHTLILWPSFENLSLIYLALHGL